MAGALLGKLPQFRYGVGYATTLEPGVPPVDVMAWPEPHAAAHVVDAADYGADGWDEPADELVTLTFRGIPSTAELGSYGIVRAGWDDVDGWDAWLRWARSGYDFQVILDRDAPAIVHRAYLVEPDRGGPTATPQLRRDLTVTLRDGDGVPWAGL